ncbi:DNA repair protein complementing XP-C cells [Spea bombifrons]|uniref:DNA repair protein complementing XP-C cells n=1 Tax=Spea bombifrons TaxID=233779 RepID=UPI00234BCB4E|nr:DNA repair protein complementing XP-C cells [Spea bombifrons]
MGKRRGSVDIKTGCKKPRKQPVKRRKVSQANAAEQEDSKEAVFEDGRVPTKKSKPTASGEPSFAARPGKKILRQKKSADKELKQEDTDQEIRDLLKLEEKDVPNATAKEESASEDGDDSEDEWEDVEELNGPVLDDAQATTSLEPTLPTQPVEIEIETAEAARKRQRREKKKAEFAAYLRRMMNKFSKELREDTHKVHLLCLLGNGFYRSETCNLPDLQAVALSVVPVRFTNNVRVDLTYLTNLIKWFTETFTLNPEMSADDGGSLSTTLERRFGVYGVRDEVEMVHIFLIILRALQLLSRLVLSLQPIPLKDPPAKSKSTNKSSSRVSKKSNPSPKGNKKNPKQKREKNVKQEVTLSGESGEEEKQKLTDSSGSRKRALGKKGKKAVKVENDEETKTGKTPKKLLRRKAASKVTYKEESKSGPGSSDSDFSCSDDDDSDFSDWEDSSFERKVKKVSGLINEKPEKGAQSSKRSPATPGRTKSKGSPKNNSTQPNRRGKIISTDDEEEEIVQVSNGSDQWAEVYLVSEEKWVSVDCVHGTVGKPQLCFKTASKPVTYVVGIDNAGYVKDVTRRYDPEWMTSTRKRRVDEDWWEETLRPYSNPNTEQQDREDAEFEAKMLDKPLPTSITEFKNHPLYALKRHLLKYEAIYPETSAILGYCRGEAVYSRSCVHILHSRDTWLKEARVVRLGEVPYKMVKGQSNRARKARLADPEKRDNPDLALFGLWQTEDYQPPVSVDGKVPRNEFGNVYLFKPSMLPIGCAHLRVPNLHRVARKLNIDCVPAITGFDFHCGFSHPVTDGYIVCEEHKDILLAAWDNDQAEMERKQKEKREKRAMGNWKLLIKGLLIRERLKARYGKKETDHPCATAADGGFSSDEEEVPTESLAEDVSVSWPQNRQTEEAKTAKPKSKREKKGEAKNLFPFEKK